MSSRSSSKTIDKTVPDHIGVHLIQDNASSHKTPTVRRWLAQHPRFVLHFTPTSSSSINLVERWFAELTTKLLRRGQHHSVRALDTEIREWTDTWNENPRPYVWTTTAEEILTSIRHGCQRINRTTDCASAPRAQAAHSPREHPAPKELRLLGARVRSTAAQRRRR